MESGFMIFSVLFAPLMVVIALFNFQNHVGSITAMHSYPLTRNQIFATNALAGMILLVLPLFILCVMMILPTHQYYRALFRSTRNIPILMFQVSYQYGALHNSILVLSKFFLITVLSFLLCLLLYNVAAMLSGNTIMTLVLSVALLFLPTGLLNLAGIISEYYVFGFYPRVDLNGYFHSFFIQLALWWPDEGHMRIHVISYSVIIIVLAACCVFATNKRAHEQARYSLVFPFSKNALIFILSVCGLLLIGYVFFGIFWSTSALYIGFVIGFFSAYCIAQMAAEKTFNILNKAKDFIQFGKFGAVTVILALLIIVFTRFWYEQHIPRFGDIKGVQILDVDVLVHNHDILTYTTLSELLVKDTEIISEVISLHQIIISERDVLRRPVRWHGSNDSGQYLDILYKLNNGNVIVRSYFLPEPFMNENDVHRLLARSQLSISLLQNRPDLINRIELWVFGYQSRPLDIPIYRRENILEFVNVLMKDQEQLLQGNEIASAFIHANIVSIPVTTISTLNSLRFEIAYNDHSHVHEWLIEKGLLVQPCS